MNYNEIMDLVSDYGLAVKHTYESGYDGDSDEISLKLYGKICSEVLNLIGNQK